MIECAQQCGENPHPHTDIRSHWKRDFKQDKLILCVSSIDQWFVIDNTVDQLVITVRLWNIVSKILIGQCLKLDFLPLVAVSESLLRSKKSQATSKQQVIVQVHAV